ncbi:endothelial differentiation-related factor 1 homolog [Drosophila bipectinata]|uniref:endothelial differentiation-related factor 1 homolog n=1 Tax=Drosophila bipectinata TaxID=42026 RepID=UPI0038B36842
MSDWDQAPLVLRKKAPKSSTLKTESAVNQARRQGVAVDTQQKYGAGTNKQHVTTKNTAKLDRETEELRHDKIPLDVGKLIQQGRQTKGLSQKDLATKICEKQQVVTDYEAGRGIPNNLILGKMERVLGIKLRGKERGQPIAPPATARSTRQQGHKEHHQHQESGGWSTVSGRRK